MLGGPRVGPGVLEEILCGGKVEVDVTGARPLGVGPTGSAIPPRLRRFVIARDGGMCTVAGCGSPPHARRLLPPARSPPGDRS